MTDSDEEMLQSLTAKWGGLHEDACDKRREAKRLLEAAETLDQEKGEAGLELLAQLKRILPDHAKANVGKWFVTYRGRYKNEVVLEVDEKTGGVTSRAGFRVM